jgi:hypothetical protein
MSGDRYGVEIYNKGGILVNTENSEPVQYHTLSGSITIFQAGTARDQELYQGKGKE